MQALTYLTPDQAHQQIHRFAVPVRPARRRAVSTIDPRGCAGSGATPAAQEAYERALAAYQTWHSGAEVPLAQALREAPDFVMAHVLRAYLLVCGRDPARVLSARPVLACAAALPANERERMHLAVLRAVLADDYECVKSLLDQLLWRFPRDVLALQVAHAFDYMTGDLVRLNMRVAATLPAWSRDLPGYNAVLAMHAFSLEECGEYQLAEENAHAALELDRSDARAHHVLAHVFEMTENADAGVRWMGKYSDCWGQHTVVATHCWWHVSLFHLARGRLDCALDCYDRRIRGNGSTEIADLIDAAALLWRLALLGAATAERWEELAAAWAPHIEDRFCSFTDVHAMLAFVGAGDWARAEHLRRTVAASAALPTRHGATSRLLGLPACRALIAYGRGDHTLAVALLASLPSVAHRLGGSHAQRDVLNLTLLDAVQRMRRPGRRQAAA